LARLQMEDADGGPLTETGEMMGTADFMAPEQGLDSHSVDIRADIYSLGCTLYMLLCGHAPFVGPDYGSKYKKLLAHSQRPIPSIRELRQDVPAELEAVLLRMVAKVPGDRFVCPGDVAQALQGLANGHDILGLAATARAKIESADEGEPSGAVHSIPE